MTTATQTRRVLHVGCGPKNPMKLQATFRRPGWEEVRLDINPDVQPDIVGTMTDMSAVETASMDAVWSSHNIEHLEAHEVPLAVAEFYRVIKPGGFVLITCPDAQAIARLVVEDKLDEPAYTSPAGPITPTDMLWGFGRSIAQGNYFMAHRTGFTARTLRETLERGGFVRVTCRTGSNFDLWADGYKAGA